MSEEIVTTDAGAVTPESPVAEQVSETTITPETTSTGTEPEATTAEPSGTEEQVTETRTPTESHQKTLEERVAELTEKRVAEVEQKLTAKLQEVTQAKQLDFIPDLDFEKVNAHIQDVRGQIEQLRLDGKDWDADLLEDTLAKTRAEIRANEERKQQYMQQQEQQHVSQQQIAAINEQIASASALVAKEHNIPADVWKKGEEFFIAERQSKPLIDAQYREKVMLQGPVAAMLWAKEYVEKNMGKKEQDLINSKETAKLTLPQGKTAAGAITDAGAEKLAALKTAAASGNPSDLAAYSRALRESRIPT